MSDAFGLTETVDVSNTDNGADDVASDVEAEPKYLPNETSDFYIAFGNHRSAVGDSSGVMAAVNESSDGKVMSEPEITPYDIGVDDMADLFDEYSDAEPQEKLWLASSCVKGEFGDRQAAENPDDLGIGLDTDGDGAPRPFPNDRSNNERFRYADEYADELPTIETVEMPDDVAAKFRSAGIDPEAELGVGDEGLPLLPAIDGEHFPLVAHDDDDVQEFVNMVAELPKEPSVAGQDASDAVQEREDDGDDASDDGDDASDDASDGETWYCARESSDGQPCRKEVEQPGHACHWHDEDGRILIDDVYEAAIERGVIDGRGAERHAESEQESSSDDDSSEQATLDDAGEQARAEYVAELIEQGVDPQDAETAADAAGF